MNLKKSLGETKATENNRPRRNRNQSDEKEVSKPERPARPKRGEKIDNKDKVKERPVRRRRNEEETKLVEEKSKVVNTENEQQISELEKLDLNELADLESEILEEQTEMKEDEDVTKFVLDNNSTEHQIRHKRVTKKDEVSEEFKNSIELVGIVSEYNEKENDFESIEALIQQTEDIDLSSIAQEDSIDEEEAFIEALINGTADKLDGNDSNMKKSDDSEFSIERLTEVGNFESLDNEEESNGDLDDIPSTEELNNDINQIEEPVVDAVLNNEVTPSATKLTEIPTDSILNQLRILSDDILSGEYLTCNSTSEISLKLNDDNQGNIEKAGEFEFTLPIYKVYNKGKSVKVNKSFEYNLGLTNQVEVDFGCVAAIPKGYVLYINTIAGFNEKMHLEFKGRHYITPEEAINGVRIFLQSESNIAYLPAYLPVFIASIIKYEKNI